MYLRAFRALNDTSLFVYRTPSCQSSSVFSDVTIHFGSSPEIEKTITVLVRGSPLSFPDHQPLLKDSRTLVPVRGVFGAMSAAVDPGRRSPHRKH